MTDRQPTVPMDIDVTQIVKVTPVPFVIDLVIDGQILRMRMDAMNLESMLSQLSILATANLPRVQGYNLYSLEGKLLASVSAVEFLGKVAAQTPLANNPADKSAAGFRVVPTVAPTSQSFRDSLDKARNEGRLPQ